MMPKWWKEQRWIKSVQKQMPPINYITLHYAYFVVVCLVMSVVFWRSGGEGKGRGMEYTDALFLVVSAMTEAGLNTVSVF